ncbi:MAG: DNA-3-methyladenine glycosylase 2 family protein [Chloroflexi bacterium]|nr:MAG: DNA-3-methyladenine glycosylase 2 family protein [Chloroflexota bacterium]
MNGEEIPREIAKGTRLVARRDPAMAKLIKRAGPMELRDPSADSFGALVRSIMYQQLAGAAANAIHGRFLKLFAPTPVPSPASGEGLRTASSAAPSYAGLSPAAVLALTPGLMRAAGVSGPKEAAISDLARKVADGTVPLEDVDSLSDDELVARLVQVRGIGRWTAEMFLMFQLRRLDVWPVDDYGVRKGWTLTHRKREMIAPRALQLEGEIFRPYRSVAAWYCWRAVENIVLPT